MRGNCSLEYEYKCYFIYTKNIPKTKIKKPLSASVTPMHKVQQFSTHCQLLNIYNSKNLSIKSAKKALRLQPQIN